jgi:hypothetical protein
MSTINKAQFWQDHITAWQGSGLSQVAYCKQRDGSVTPCDDEFTTGRPIGIVRQRFACGIARGAAYASGIELMLLPTSNVEVYLYVVIVAETKSSFCTGSEMVLWSGISA